MSDLEAQSREAMADLRRILSGRAAFYAKADAELDTSGKSEAESAHALITIADELLGGHPVSAPAPARRPRVLVAASVAKAKPARSNGGSVRMK